MKPKQSFMKNGQLVYNFSGWKDTYLHTLYITQHSAVTLALHHSAQISPHCTSHQVWLALPHTTLYHILQHWSAPYDTILHNTTLHCIQVRYVGLSFLRKLGKEAKVQLHCTFNKIIKTPSDLFLYLCGWIVCTFVNTGKHW